VVRLGQSQRGRTGPPGSETPFKVENDEKEKQGVVYEKKKRGYPRHDDGGAVEGLVQPTIELGARVDVSRIGCQDHSAGLVGY
jgi:hypothetical protein